jgi:uncharacterized protein YcaQ
MSDALSVSAAAARRFLVRSLGLEEVGALPDVRAALDLLEFVQMDSINVCGRMHDLILWPRVREYRPAMLHALLYETPRGAFEDYFPNLCVLPLRDYPYFVRAMRARVLHAEESAVAERLLRRLEAEGPLRTRAGGAQDGHTISGWGTRTTVAARVLEKLWRQGRLTIQRRENFERWFDLTERALPEAAEHHAPDAPLPTESEERAYKLRKRLRARRLFRRPNAGDRAVLGPDALVPVIVEDAARPWYVLAEDAPALVEAESLPVDGDALHLLAPLDPLVYDRERTRAVFGFDYTWEVYTPAAKRRWGYYVLPVLRGERLIARVDPKIDRAARTLGLHSVLLEPGVDAEGIAPALAARLADFARFLGAERVLLGRVEPEPAREALEAALSRVC